MSERVLVTGAAGYLGSVLVPHLLQNGYAVRALDFYKHKHFPLASCTGYSGFEPVKGDCREESVIKECLKGVDWIIPLAAIVGAPACELDRTAAYSTTYDAIRLLNLWRGSIPVLFPNTNSGYGTTTTETVCTEDSPLNPISWYGKMKREAEDCLVNRDNAVIFRLATVFGPSPRMRMDLLVNDFVYRATRDRSLVLYESHFRRNFVHIHDIARLFLFGIKNFTKLQEKKIYNAGLSRCMTKRGLCEEIRKWVSGFQFFEAKTGSDIDKRDYNVSSQRLEDAGFKCATSLAQGIQELVRLYKMTPPTEFSNV